MRTINNLLVTNEPRHDKAPSTDDLIQLLKFCLKTYFTFNGQIYEQVKGTPMGSPISGVIAEAVLQQLEREAMEIYKPKFWTRYVDDTFTIIKQRDKIKFMGILNSIYPDIQFTAEEEANGKLAFLDVHINRNPDGSIDTEVYRKTTSTDRMLHNESNHPNAHKVSCIRTLFNRINTHCSTRAAKQKERAYLYQTCIRHGYSRDFIQRCVTPRLRQPTESTNETSAWRVLPYIQGVSETAARILAPHGVKVAHRPDQTLRKSVMRPKETLVKEESSSVIYRINCSSCARHYVGETAKRLRTRIHEHKLAVRRHEQRSQIWTHMEEQGHGFDFQGTEILARDETKGGRLLKEAWFSNEHSLNRHIDMPSAYQALRHQERLKGDRPLGLDRAPNRIPQASHGNQPNECGTIPAEKQWNILEQHGGRGGVAQCNYNTGGKGGLEQYRPRTRAWAKLQEQGYTTIEINGDSGGGKGIPNTSKALPHDSTSPLGEGKRQRTRTKAIGLSPAGMTKPAIRLTAGGREGCGPVTRAMSRLGNTL